METKVNSSQSAEPANTARRTVLPGCNEALETYERVWRFWPHHLVDCATIEDVQAAVIAAAAAGLRVRAMGNGFSWAPHVRTNDVCIRTTGLNRILAVDPARKTIRVQAGVRLGDLTRALGAHGLCLPSLSFLDDASIGGAVVTATHGTSPHWGSLSDFVTSMKIVLASGELKEFGPQSPPDEFRAACVSVGMLGIVVELEFQAIDMPWVTFGELKMSLAAFRQRRAAILAKYEHVWVHWILGRDEVVVKYLEKRPTAAWRFHPYVTDDNALWINRDITSRILGRLRGEIERVGMRLRGEPITPPQPDRPQVWNSMQYAMPADRADETIDRIRASEFARLYPGRVVELKFLKGVDHSFLGPNAEGDTVTFNLWWVVDEAVKYTVFETFEEVMLGLNGKIHWGKFHRAPDLAYVKKVYPRWAAFDAVRKKYDPTGMFSIFDEEHADHAATEAAA
jgi:L-gulonolactone oxidase